MTYKMSILDFEAEKIKCPVVVKFGDTVTRFENGAQLAAATFECEPSYTTQVIDSVDINDGVIELNLVEQAILDTSWANGKDVSFF